MSRNQTSCHLILLTALVAGCVSTGSRFDHAKADNIQRGQTTEAELRAWFGKPFDSRSLPDGFKLLTWQYTKAGFAVGVTEQQILGAKLNPKGVVIDYQTRSVGKSGE
jgi:hypothetical protein